MTELELLAPARNADIGIAAIDCGADAVYVAGPDFGARKAAGNEFDEIARLCDYAHKFGARIFLTVNTTVPDNQIDELHSQMVSARDAGVDAFIIRDTRIAGFKDLGVELHASTQCAIRDVQRARFYENLGCSRIILERELPLRTVKEICAAVSCEVEFFVHGALCMCYSGDCRLSEFIDGRSADKGECIQACRSLYDLEDSRGNVIIRNKALLSLKDYNLKSRLSDLADAGVCSFKIEGRLKNASYVKNVVRDYDLALNALISANPDKYCRASHGRVCGGFNPDSSKTFNRGYTQLFLDGKRGKWASMETPKSMGEQIGTVASISSKDKFTMEVRVRFEHKGTILKNGDGFAFVSKNAITGFRADVCETDKIICKVIPELRAGTVLYRNINTAFEKEIDTHPCRRELTVRLDLTIEDKFKISVSATCQDGRMVTSVFNCDDDNAQNTERMLEMLRTGLGKRHEQFNFSIGEIVVSTTGNTLPLLSSATINGIRRCVASDLDSIPCPRHHGPEINATVSAGTLPPCPVKGREDELMRSKYCIRYELGMCPVHQGAAPGGELFLRNNGRRFALGFDCRNCEMTVSPVQK